MKPHKASAKKSVAARPKRDEPAVARHDDADYWQSRAERTRKQSQRYKQPAVRQHFAKIAAGYDALARRARAILDRKG
jgi:hypothetical protein